jgi:glutathione synthase/RimK-type ligase-like ATP-grasp enzyme
VDLEILDYSVYGNPCDRDSDRLLAAAAERAGLSVRIVALTRDSPVAPAAPWAWLRYDLRSADELRWIVATAEALAQAGKRVFPRARALLLSEDKYETYQALRHAGVAAVASFPLAEIHACGPRAVVKPRAGWGGMGMRVVDRGARVQVPDGRSEEDFFCQPHIAHKQTWTVAAAAGRVLACVEKRAGPADFRTNERCGGTSRLADPPEGTPALTLAALAAVELVAGTVDFLETSDGLQVLEVNSAPGLYYAAAPGLDLAGPMVEAVLAQMGRP